MNCKFFKKALLIILLCLASCENDLVNEQHLEPVPDTELQEDALLVTQHSWEHLKNQLPKVEAELQKFKKRPILGIGEESDGHDFWVETEDVQVIEFDDHTSYTFMARRHEYLPGQFQNYVFRLYDDETYQQHLLTYYYTHDEDGNIIMNTEQMHITAIDGPSPLAETGCAPHLVNVGNELVCGFQNRCFGPQADGNHETAGECSCDGGTTLNCWPPGTMACTMEPIYDWNFCSGTNGDGGGTTDNGNQSGDPGNGNDTGGGTGNTNGTNNDPNDTQNDPNNDQNTNTEVPFKRNIIITEIEACINGGPTLGGQGDGITIEDDLLASLGLTNIQLAAINSFLNDNQCSVGAQGLALDYINLQVELEEALAQFDFEAAIQHLANYLRAYGEDELDIVADYYESLIPEFPTMQMGEVWEIYYSLKDIADDIPEEYAFAIAGVYFSDLVMPILTYALFEASAGLAVKLLQKIPLPAVLVGSRLNKMVQRVVQLGVPGNQPYVRELHGTTVNKARELFTSLTKNAVSISQPNAQGTIVANMGNGNFITFRTVSSSNSPGVISTIDLNFSQLLGTNSFKLKFYP